MVSESEFGLEVAAIIVTVTPQHYDIAIKFVGYVQLLCKNAMDMIHFGLMVILDFLNIVKPAIILMHTYFYYCFFLAK